MTQPMKTIPREVGVVGSRPASSRPWLRRLGLAVVAAAGVAATLSTYQAGTTNPTQWALAQGPEQTVQAQVVGKIIQPEGVSLLRKKFGRDYGDAWQPINEVSTSSYQLILSIPNEIKPVVVAVSRDIYDDHCNHLNRKDFRPASRTIVNTTFKAGCGDMLGAGGEVLLDAPDKLDTVSLSFTRSKIDDSIQITRLNGQEKLAQSLLEKSELMRDTRRNLTRGSTPRG